MFFLESSNRAQLVFGNDTYHLNIKTMCQDNHGTQTERIYLTHLAAPFPKNHSYIGFQFF